MTDKLVRAFLWFLVASLMLAPSAARAADIGPIGDTSVAVHGFVSPGFIASTGNNYLANTKGGTFEFTEVGINFTVPLTEKLRTGMQLFSRSLGRFGNYTPKVDWFYLDYRYEDWLGLRAGRVKIPFGLYNDTSDIDAARVPILLPQSLYSLQSRDFLLAQTGVEIYGRINLRSAGALEYRHYGGTIFLDGTAQTSLATPVQEINVPFVVGERLMWETPVEGLRLGGSVQALRLNATFLVKDRLVGIQVPAVLAVASVEYAAHDLLLAAEYSKWRVGVESTDPTILRPGRVVSERGYVMSSLRLNRWLTPGLYYSLFFPDVDHRSGRAAMQHDVAATLRFDINAHWLFKVEGHYMNGTADASPDFNDGKSRDVLDRSWAVFLAKTTAYF
ncbi:MAG: hypothetical protein JWO86_4127 [Myxococcaceae bacterium]|nr:hypothetical protein [Myxococcaceae bacterium]